MYNNRVPYYLLTSEERAALEAHKDNLEFYSITHRNWEVWTSARPFYDSGVYRIASEPLVIPWAALSKDWKWAAVDQNENLWVYKDCPTIDRSRWISRTGGSFSISKLVEFTRGAKPWYETLVERPTNV